MHRYLFVVASSIPLGGIGDGSGEGAHRPLAREGRVQTDRRPTAVRPPHRTSPSSYLKRRRAVGSREQSQRVVHALSLLTSTTATAVALARQYAKGMLVLWLYVGADPRVFDAGLHLALRARARLRLAGAAAGGQKKRRVSRSYYF